MNAYDYLIIGGGMTADAAVRGIRELDSKGTIAILSSEADPPYKRPPLSKGLWSGNTKIGDIGCDTGKNGVQLLLDRTATNLDRVEHYVVDEENNLLGYGKLLLATGGRPRRLPFNDSEVVYYRTLADYRHLQAGLEHMQRYAVVGGGFIGCEMAAALAGKSKTVTMIYPEDALGAGIFPAELAQQLSGYYREKGITLLENLKLSGLEKGSNGFSIHLENGRTLAVDAVVAGIGIAPNTELAEVAGLNVDDGILVDDQLKTSDDAIYAAGDVANFYNPALDSRMRVEHEDNALTMGHMAGRNMAGAADPYEHLPFFYSDLFDLGYEAVGELNGSGETVGEWEDLHSPGVWAYLTDGQVRGALLWNLFGQVDAARALIAEDRRTTPSELKDRLRTLIEAGADS